MIFEEETNTTNKIDWQSKEEGNEQFTELLKNHPDIEQKIRSELKIPTEEIIKTTDDALEICFDYFVRKNGKRWGPIWNIYKNTKKVVEKLRHYTIVAHGLKGVSKEKIMELYGSELVIEDLRKIVNSLSRDENIFNEINTILDKYIKEL